jgi:Na+/H+-dicarboxylate symporter
VIEGLALLLDDPVCNNACDRVLSLYEKCTLSGLLTMPMADMTGEPTCLHHTFTHAKALAALVCAESVPEVKAMKLPCEEKFGIETSLIRFGIPLGMVMHKPVSAVYNLLIVFYFAERYDVSCSVGWLVVAVFISSIIAISTPPIPGGGAIAYTIIFAQMGIPSQALAKALAIDIITDFFVTAFEMLVLPVSLLNISAGLGMLNSDVLRS